MHKRPVILFKYVICFKFLFNNVKKLILNDTG